MTQPVLYPVKPHLAADAWINREAYDALYKESIEAPDTFWSRMAREHILWHKHWDRVQRWDFVDAEVRWFEGAELNVSVNCVERHLAKRAGKPAIIWEPDDPNRAARVITYAELFILVNQTANALKALGVKRGDRVCLYMPMVPEAAIAMLACARIGAIHSVVFAGFSAESLRERVNASESKVVITANEGDRGGRKLKLKTVVDEALADAPTVEHVLVFRATEADTPMQEGRDIWWHDIVPEQKPVCAPVMVQATDPLFILYTSGSTGKPKGVYHGSGGYLLYAALTHKYIFDVHDDDVYWCTADIGWITGHSYVVYGPLANGATTVMFEGTPQYPDWSRFWQVIDKHKVTICYTAPTAIRAIQAQGDAYVDATSRDSLRILGSVGEPINPEAWEWFYHKVGKARSPIMDTWWQTETGGVLISPLPGVTDLKPGSATRPFFGVEPVLLDDAGQRIEGPGKGYLCIARSWPGQMMGVWGNHTRFKEGYFQRFPGYYFTSDGCTRDEDGYYWITGRVDDVINVSGHRLSTAEIESALVLHPQVAEAGVVGMPHPIKGEGIYAFVTLNAGVEPTENLKTELVLLVRHNIGALASPDVIQYAPGLPKTRSGKIMRRILRKIVAGEAEMLGDTSTLADPGVVDELVKGWKALLPAS